MPLQRLCALLGAGNVAGGAGDRQRVAPREDEVPGGELDALGHRGGGAERHERTDQLGVRADDWCGWCWTPGCCLVGCSVAKPMGSTTGSPGQREGTLVGSRRQGEELQSVDVVGGEPDAQEITSSESRGGGTATFMSTGRRKLRVAEPSSSSPSWCSSALCTSLPRWTMYAASSR
jgi:hypothetical protein